MDSACRGWVLMLLVHLFECELLGCDARFWFWSFQFDSKLGAVEFCVDFEFFFCIVGLVMI